MNDRSSLWFDSNVDPRTKTIYLGGDIDEQSAASAVKALWFLDHASDGDIKLIINSYGGDVYQGLAIYDAIKSCSCHVTTIGTGAIMSMATIIIQAGDQRLLSPTSTMMIHVGSAWMDDHAHNVKRANEEYLRLERLCEQLYLDAMRKTNPKMKLAELRKLLTFDTYLSPQKAIELGLADGIFAGSR